MANRFKSKKSLFTIAVVIIILLNLYTLSVAYPTMDKPLNFGGADLPRDFSVYYLAAWRLFHNPSQTFTTAPLNDGEPAIYPPITPYKYTPSFLVLVAPLLSLSYYQAFWVFDAIQFALLPIMALLLYKLLENKNPLIVFAVIVAVLVLPYPLLDRGLSVSYFMQWAEGQAKVLLAFLLLASFYLGNKGRATLSGIAFALGAFDPRFTVLALPLFLFYNKGKLKAALAAMVAVFALPKSKTTKYSQQNCFNVQSGRSAGLSRCPIFKRLLTSLTMPSALTANKQTIITSGIQDGV